MSLFWNTRTKNISPYVPGEQPKDRDFIKLNTNENPYPPSPKVIEAIQKAADEKLRLYPDPECTQFREAIAAYYGIKKEQVFAGNGSDEILGFAFGAFFESGAEGSAAKPSTILFPDITYSFYPVYAGLWNIPFRTVPLCEEFYIRADEYKIECGGVILPNPNAPTGIEMWVEDLLSIADYLEKQGKVLIVDEAYIAFSGSEIQSIIPFINKHPNMLVVHTLSKAASLAGLRVGYAVGNEKLIEGLCRIRDSFNSYTLDRLALAGATAAMEDKKYYDEIKRKVVNTRDRVKSVLRGLGFDVLESAANFLFIKPPIISGEELFTALREKGILTRHFNKDRIKDFLRVSIGTDKEMDIFLDACRVILGYNPLKNIEAQR